LTGALLDDLIRAQQQRRRDGQAERLRGFQVDREIQPHRPLDRKLRASWRRTLGRRGSSATRFRRKCQPRARRSRRDSRAPAEKPETFVERPPRESPSLDGFSANSGNRSDRERGRSLRAESVRNLGGEGSIECALEVRCQCPGVQIARHVGGDPQPLADSAQARLGVPQYRASRSR